MSNFLEQFTKDVRANVPGYIAVTVTEVSSGVCYVSDSADENFDPEIASAYNLEVAKAKYNAIEALGLDSQIQDIIITLNNQIHMIDISENREYFIYLAVDSSKANMGMTRALLKKYKKDIVAELS
ncbi:hypothetical protein BZARG_1990 [Bizionia argentinensis JUB59]|uniref:Roadblock/LC7 domain-containing protein n=1 Tax=Bizionia argentinensis JUB59 TaxID=1046627 RepID=G2EFX9_9FLAO|nr:hypothetical protein [Bizionia argentinensis]EGV42657.1 hypothetical protein BZARG_1990 [Bizionia argentinensis JUB59]